ncbi:MAG: hypothetical protein ACYDG2_02980, partial [Ruminiclostridium sp.]
MKFLQHLFVIITKPFNKSSATSLSTKFNKSHLGDISSKNSSSSLFSLLRKIRIQTRLILSFVFIILLLLIFTCVYTYNKSSKAIDDNVRSYSLQVLNQTSIILKNNIMRFEKYASDMVLNPTIQSSLEKYIAGDESIRSEEKYNIKNFSQLLTAGNNDIKFFGMYSAVNFEEIFSLGSLNMIDNNKAILDASSNTKATTWVKYSINGADMIGISKSIFSTSSGDYMGVITQIPSDNIFIDSYKNLDIGVDKNNKKPFDIFIVAMDGTIISARGDDFPLFQSNDISKHIGQKLKEFNKESGNFDSTINGEKCLITYASLKTNDWYIVSSIPYYHLNSSANDLR